MTDIQTVALLNELIRVCIDSAHGFQTAAGAMQSFDLKQALEEFSQERQRFAEELQALVAGLGGEAAGGGSLSGMLQTGWFNLKTLVAGHDVSEVVVQCERGEEAAANAYQAALREELPLAVRPVIARQYEEVDKVLQRLRTTEMASARL